MIPKIVSFTWGNSSEWSHDIWNVVNVTICETFTLLPTHAPAHRFPGLRTPQSRLRYIAKLPLFIIQEDGTWNYITWNWLHRLYFFLLSFLMRNGGVGEAPRQYPRVSRKPRRQLQRIIQLINTPFGSSWSSKHWEMFCSFSWIGRDPVPVR